MAELNTCCAPDAQGTCCEPADKAECCGAEGGCGCSAARVLLVRKRTSTVRKGRPLTLRKR
jgi:hypothetical protein